MAGRHRVPRERTRSLHCTLKGHGSSALWHRAAITAHKERARQSLATLDSISAQDGTRVIKTNLATARVPQWIIRIGD